jgi:hypothetical protein
MDGRERGGDMVRRLKPLGFLGISLVLVVACGDKTDPSPPAACGDSSATYAIHEGEPHPACAEAGGRVDAVAPQTVDTVQWGPPQKLSSPVNDLCPNDDPEISADGQTLYFYWSPTHVISNEDLLQGTTGVYYAQRTGGTGEFGTPRFLDLRKGTSGGAGDGHPRIAPSGDKVFFHSVRAQNTGYRQTPPVDDFLDVYVASLTDHVACTAENLASINSTSVDGEPGLSPDGTVLYFASTRPGAAGTDLYYSTLADGSWSAPTSVGAPINSSAYEAQAAFAANDPDTVYFTSDRNGIGMAIWRSHRVAGAWQEPELVIQGQVGSASLTADGSVMYFAHVLTDNDSSDPVFDSDIYYVQRK